MRVIIAYEGIQYRYMAPGVMETAHLDYLREHLRILSGFYGLLRPFDGVTPYRLEMQAKLAVDGCRDLYQFWGDRLARQLAAETDFVLNLASREYSRAVEAYLLFGYSPPRIEPLPGRERLTLLRSATSITGKHPYKNPQIQGKRNPGSYMTGVFHGTNRTGPPEK